MSAFRSEGVFFPPSEWKTQRTIKRATLCPETKMIVIDWNVAVDRDSGTNGNMMNIPVTSQCNGEHRPSSTSTSYACVWLRDFCRCPECFDEPSQTKKTNLQDIDPDITALTTYPEDCGTRLRVSWGDGHGSVYPAAWLWCSRFRDTPPDPYLDLPQELWRAKSIRGRLREFDFDDLMTSDRVLYDWIREVKVLGLTMIKNAPQNLEAMTQLGKRVGYLKDSNFGLVSDVYAPADPQKPDYTAGNLYFHTDLSYYQQQPGIELLHCIKQFDGEGGDSTLVDGFQVAAQLKGLDPVAFRALSTHHVEFYQNGLKGHGKYFQLARNKIIRLDSNGDPQQITYSNHSRASIMRMPPTQVAPFYKALRLFVDLLYDPGNVFTYKMKPGDIIVLNNFRVLHGRKGFEMKKGSERHLATAYMDWDLLYSRMRVLAQDAGEYDVV